MYATSSIENIEFRINFFRFAEFQYKILIHLSATSAHTHGESHTSIPNARGKIQITSFFYFYMDFYSRRGSDQFILAKEDDTFRTDCSIVLEIVRLPQDNRTTTIA